MCVIFENEIRLKPETEVEKQKKLQGKVICPDCGGRGMVENVKCEQCSGSGYQVASWSWSITNRETLV